MLQAIAPPMVAASFIQATHIICVGVLIMAHSAEWLPVSIAPSDEDLEVCVLDFDGIVHALVYPCHKDGAEWVDAPNKEHVHIQPTHWRKWTANH